MSVASELALQEKANKLMRARVKALSPKARTKFEEWRSSKEVRKSLMPDAPDRKDKRKRRFEDDTEAARGRKQVYDPSLILDADIVEVVPDVNIYFSGCSPSFTNIKMESSQQAPPSSPSSSRTSQSRESNSMHPAHSPQTPARGSNSASNSSCANENTYSTGQMIFYDEDMDLGLAEYKNDINLGSDLDSDDDDNVVDGEFSGYKHIQRDAIDEPATLPDFIDPGIVQRIEELDCRDDKLVGERLSQSALVFDWDADPFTFKGVREVFTGKPGPTFPVEEMTSPLTTVRMFLTDEFVDLIVNQTNLYAEQLKANPNVLLNSRMSRWKPVTKEEMWLFLGILLFQGLYPFTVEREYWYPKVPFIEMDKMKEIMPCNRFQLLKKCLHFADNTQLPVDGSREDRKLYKIKPVIDHLNDRFRSLYYPQQEVSLDESLLLWKGRLGISQKIDNKAAKIGVKSYEICESATGYLWTFKVHTGAGKEQIAAGVLRQDQEISSSQHVYRLAHPLLNKGHTIIMDSFYNSPLLSRALKLNGTDTMGTLRISRQFVPETLKRATKAEMRVGEFYASHTHDLSIMLWRDSNIVALISTFHKTEVGGREKHGTYRYKPEVVLHYNKAMGGVDRKDQLLSAFPMERSRNQIWYKKLFRRLLNVSVMNASILYKHVKNIPSREFRQSLVIEIIAKFRGQLTGQISRHVTVVSTTNAQVMSSRVGKLMRPTVVGGHYPEKGESKKMRCKLCPSRTSWRCNVCKVALCAKKCFIPFHNA